MISGAQIRAARERAGLTQQELAARLNVTNRTVSNWELGRHIPLNSEARIREALDIRDGSLSVDSHQEVTRRGAEHLSDVELIAELARRLGERRSSAGGSFPGGVVDIAWGAAGQEDPLERVGREAKEDLDRSHLRLAADTGQEGVEPDDLPNET